MKVCTKCLKDMIDEAAYCPYCAHPVDVVQLDGTNAHAEGERLKGKRIHAGNTLMLVAIVIAFYAIFLSDGASGGFVTPGAVFNRFVLLIVAAVMAIIWAILKAKESA